MTTETLRFWLQMTARAATVIFLVAFTAESLPRWLAARRRGLMLGFVVAFTVHLGLIGALAASRHGHFVEESGMVTLVVGAIVYALIAGLGVSSLRAVPWARFETVASWIVALMLARPIVMKAFVLRTPFYVAFALVFGAAFFMRVRAALARARASFAPTRASLAPEAADHVHARASSAPHGAELRSHGASSAPLEAESTPTAA